MAACAEKLCSEEEPSEEEEYREDYFTIDLSTGQMINEKDSVIEDRIQACCDSIQTQSDPTEKENDPKEVLKTMQRKDSSENIVIEIRPNVLAPSPPPMELKRSGSMENVSAKDYLVARANRKQKIKQKNLELQKSPNTEDVKYQFPTKSPILSKRTIHKRTNSDGILKNQEINSHGYCMDIAKENSIENVCVQGEKSCTIEPDNDLTKNKQEYGLAKCESVTGVNILDTNVVSENEKHLVASHEARLHKNNDHQPNVQAETNNNTEDLRESETVHKNETLSTQVSVHGNAYTSLEPNVDVKINTNEAINNEEVTPAAGDETCEPDTHEEDNFDPFNASDEDDGGNIQVTTFCMQKFDDDENDGDDDLDDLLQNVPLVHSDEDMFQADGNNQDKYLVKPACPQTFAQKDDSFSLASNDTCFERVPESENKVLEEGKVNKIEEAINTYEILSTLMEAGEVRPSTEQSTLLSTNNENEPSLEDQYTFSEEKTPSIKTTKAEDKLLNELSDKLGATEKYSDKNTGDFESIKEKSNDFRDKGDTECCVLKGKPQKESDSKNLSLKASLETSAFTKPPESYISHKCPDDQICAGEQLICNTLVINDPTETTNLESQSLVTWEVQTLESIEEEKPTENQSEYLETNLDEEIPHETLLTENQFKNISIPTVSTENDPSIIAQTPDVGTGCSSVALSTGKHHETQKQKQEEIESSDIICSKIEQHSNDSCEIMSLECNTIQHSEQNLSKDTTNICQNFSHAASLEFVNSERLKTVTNEEVFSENINDVYTVDNSNKGIPELGDKTDPHTSPDPETIPDHNNICIIVLNPETESKGTGSDCLILQDNNHGTQETKLGSSNSSEDVSEQDSSGTSKFRSVENSFETEEEESFEMVPLELCTSEITDNDSEKPPAVDLDAKKGESEFSVFKHDLLLKNLKLKSCIKTDSVTTDGDYEVEEIMRNEVINDSEEVFQPIATVAAEICDEFTTDDRKEAIFLDGSDTDMEEGGQSLERLSDNYLSGCTSEDSVYEDAHDSSGEDYTTWDTFQRFPSTHGNSDETEVDEELSSSLKLNKVFPKETEEDGNNKEDMGTQQYKTVINLDLVENRSSVQTETTGLDEDQSHYGENRCVISIDKTDSKTKLIPCTPPKEKLHCKSPCMMVVPWRKSTKTCPCILNKKRLRATVKKYVKGQDQGNLVNHRKKLYDIIHSMNKRETITLPNASDFDNDMIWKLLKTLINPNEELFSQNELDSSASPPCSTEKEDLIKVFTYLHPSTNKTKFEFIPLKTPKKKTLPFNVKELFNKEVSKARKKKEVSRGLIFLKMITGKNKFIKEKKSSPEKKSNKEADATIKSPKAFQMSSSPLVLPKLTLIGRPGSSLPGTRSPKELLEEGLLSKKAIVVEDMSNDASPTLNSMLTSALEMLHTSRLDDAEKQLLQLYQRMQEKPEENTRILVQCLSNLSDICVRRSRMCRSNQMEWQWLVMHAIALLQYTVDICDSEKEASQDNQDVEWFQEYHQTIITKCKPLEDSFNRALYNCLKHEGRKFMDPYRSFSLPNTPTMPNRLGLFPLASSHQFYVNPGLNYKYSSSLNKEKKESVDDISVGLDWLSKFYRYCSDRMQTKNLGDIYNKLFKKRSRVDSLRCDDDMESVVSDSAGSLDWDHSDLQGIDEMESEQEDSPITEQSFALAVAECDMGSNGWDFFLNDRKNCKFTSVVQVASQNQNNDIEKLENRTVSKAKEHENDGKEKEIISPLHENSIKHTIAKSYARLAEKMLTEGEYDKAEVLFEQVLSIVEEIHDGTAGMLRFGANISKFLGTIKSKQGKTSEGLEYLNTALKTYRDLQDDASNFEIAVALLELGNGYSVGKNNDDGVYEDAIAAICEFFEKDLSDENMSSSTSSGKSDATNPRTVEEEQNIEEAIHCYKEALTLLDAYENEKQKDVVAKSTMRLGDCYFMQKDYDRALECYEKSLSLFHSSSTLGRENVIEHAHVMCMVGVCSFMLHMYPRAVSTFDLALHLIKYAYGLTSTFLHALLLSMMGITYYKMKNYHKCVTMCYQGFEIFCSIHGEKLPTLPKRKFWLVCQILYVMGNSYNILNLQQKAVKYLTVARTLMMACKMRERRQFMRVLQVLGDCYFAQYDYKTALQFYNEALEYGECESQVSFDEVFDPNAIGDNMTMHNQLVSKSAEAHISMQQYQNAVHYLEQAHDMQEDMGNDIKEDLIHTLTQLGQMHSTAGDVDGAIDSFNESLEVYREIHDGHLGKEMCATLGNLATMCYVKACLCEEIDRELEMILTTEQHFQDAMQLDLNPSVCVKYANFLYSQGNYDDAVMYLEDALNIEGVNEISDITYGGLEKVTLPDCLQDEVDCQEEVVLSPTVLARYLLILSHKALHQCEPAMRALIGLQKEVLERDIPIFYSVLGYAMMELSLFEEAMWCFSCAVDIESDYKLALDNYCLCLCISVFRTFIKGIEAICSHYKLPCYY